MRKNALNILFFFLSNFWFSFGYSQNINISIFTNQNIQSISFYVINGKYDVIADNKAVSILAVNDTINCKRLSDKIEVLRNKKILGVYSFIQIRGTNTDNVFAITPSNPKHKTRVYDDDIYIKSKSGELQIINDVSFEKYVAASIESEGGYVSPLEYYKVQAILCRTYAIKNFQRHLSEGFNLCDGVHCQSYRGKSIKNPSITKAAYITKGLVIVDSDQSVITATFFSNSGGQTLNSEDNWTTKIPYLRSIKDSFSLGQPNAKWEKKIPKSQWISYLIKKGYNIDSCENFSFYQHQRESTYNVGSCSIPLKRIRSDWTLKSTFFTIIPQGDTLIFKGKGFGHGVGLSQEGAIRMAQLGYNYEQIIKFYYRNVQIKNKKTFTFFEVQ
jgi:stage II sporulation protein D